MKRILFTLLAVIASTAVFAQLEEHAFFKTTAKMVSADEAEITTTATMDPGWHLYADPAGGDGMLIPTTVDVKPNSNIELLGKQKIKGKITDEDVKGVGIVHYYSKKVQYIQKVKVKKAGPVDVSIYYQTCNDEGCLPPTPLDQKVDLSKIPAYGKKVDPKKVEPTKADPAKTKVEPAKAANDPKTLASAKGNEGQKKLSEVSTKDNDASKAITAAAVEVPEGGDGDGQSGMDSNAENSTIGGTETANANQAAEVYGDYGKPVGDCGETKKGGLSMWTSFLYGILGGLAALFFPCTLPMIPMTISYFLKGSGTKREGIRTGITYGFSIFLVYFLLSLPFLFLGWGGNALNSFSTNVWVNLAFFAVFILFAFSLFGFYDISLPSWLTSKVDSKSNTKSFGGIFFMALTLAIVSFSCTGPILGLVLGNIENTKLITPAMSGFGIGLGVPFALFAMFPNLLKSMPKSGGWLTALKGAFAFVELGFAFKFLSNADLVEQWGLLKRETFIGLMIIVCILTGLYLLGKFTVKKSETFSVSRNMKIFAALFFLLGGYMSLDFFGVDVNLQGFPPPKFYSYFNKEHKLEKGALVKKHKLKGIDIYMDLEDGLAEAKKQGKPLMIDFTGWACVNCRKMEENVWTTSKVNKLLCKDYVVVSLYVDQATELPENEKFMSPFIKREVKTVGDKWFDLSLRHFRSASQPFYALIDPNTERILNSPVAYTPDQGDYAKFLECGISNYKELNP